MGGAVMGAGRPVRVADPSSVRWSSMPPSVEDHPTQLVSRSVEAVVGRLPGDGRQKTLARLISALPMRLGGLGLHCLAMLSKRLPDVTAHIMENQVKRSSDGGCLAGLHTASRCLDRAGFVNRPAWTLLRDGLRPPPPLSGEPGESQHGWQYHASSPFEHHHRETVIFAESDAADQAHLRCVAEHQQQQSSG